MIHVICKWENGDTLQADVIDHDAMVSWIRDCARLITIPRNGVPRMMTFTIQGGSGR